MLNLMKNKMINYYIGCDISLTHLGLIILNSKKQLILSKVIQTKKTDSIYDLESRLLFIRNSLDCLRDYSNARLITEQVLWTARGSGSIQLAALELFLRTTFVEWGIEFQVVFPVTLKKAIAGNGHATKSDMIEAVSKYGFTTTDDNLADAYAMAIYGMNE